MDFTESNGIWKQYSRPSYWSVTADEVDYFQDLIKQHRPGRSSRSALRQVCPAD